ncbi:retention module-containing protein [Campylobacter concisus]|uniref:retention module-containing protein n=1 Tax=Campylobacter concisus TaxID=199 RepID=UPI000D2F844C|nr:retention module-containing protein [Campylobacter concisus]
MAKEAGVVKSINGGIARALNDLTGEVRQLSVGDIVYQGEKIVTEGSNSKVTITQTDGKDITLIGKDTLTLDQDSNNNETVADISALQQAILKGTDLNALEETAAGGPQAGGNGGDGVSLSSTSFAEGGHISNINANVGSIDALSLAAGGDNSFGVSGGSAVGAGAGATGPTLPAGSIKIPLSAYTGEDVSSGLLTSFHSSIPHGYHLYRHTDGRDYLTPDDPTAPSAFEYKEGWYVSNDGKLAIGQDNAKDLAVTSTAKASNYPDDGSVAKIVDPNPSLKVFGSDNIDKITVDNAKIESVYGGVGNDNIDLKNGAEAVEIFGGSGNDGITVNNSTVSGRAAKDYMGDDTTDAISGGDGVDRISLQNGSRINGNVYGNAGKDIITVDSGAKVEGIIYGDTKTKNDKYEKAVNPSLDIEDKGADADTITLSGRGTSAKFIAGGDGDDIITVKDGARTNYIQGDEGGDTITVSGKDAYAAYINGRGGDDKIFVENGAKAGYVWGMWGNDEITVRGQGTTILRNVEGREDSDTIKILDGARVKGYVSGGRGESPSAYGGAEKSDNDNITVENAIVDGNVEGSMRNNYSGDDGIKIKNSHIGGISGGFGENNIDISNVTNLDAKTIWGNKFKDTVNIDGTLKNSTIITVEGEDTVNINAGATINNISINTGADKDTVNVNANITADVGKQSNIMTEGGIDTINIASGVTLTRTVISTGAGEETIKINAGKTGVADRITFEGSSLDTGADKDIVEITNTMFKKGSNGESSNLNTGDGDDKITIKEGTIFQDNSVITAGRGNDRVYLESGVQFNKAAVWADDGDDEIHVNGAEFNGPRGIGGVSGGAGNDKIFINDGTKFTGGSILGDGGATLDPINGPGNDEITISGTNTVLDNVNIDTGDANANAVGGAKDTVKIEDAKLKYTNIKSGNGNDEITITGNANLTGGYNKSGSGDDTITVSGNAILNNTYLQGEQGSDTITIGGNVKAKGGNFNTGAGADDKIEIKDNAELDGTTLQFEGGKSTDKATLNVTGNAVLKDISIQASSSLGEQYMNFHQSGEAKVKSLMGSQNKDVIDIAGDFTYTNANHLQTHGGDDEIKMHGGATVKVSVDMGDGKDTLTIDNATFKDSLVNMDGGNDEININAGANLTGTRIYTGDGNDTVNVRGGTFSEAEIGLDKGKNEVNIESGAVFGDQDPSLFYGEHKTYIRSDHRASQNSEDTINVKAGATVKNAEIQTYGGEDTLNIDGTVINSNINLGSGNDTVSIGKNASIDGSSTIDGGAGIDTLKIADGSIDFSRVKNFEKLDLTQGNNNINLSAKDVLDMTDSNNKLRIDGNGDDHVTLQGGIGTWNKSAIPNSDGYTVYTKTEGSHTVTLEIKDVVVHEI